MADPATRRLLDLFLVGNSELEQLEARLSAFNLFRVLRVEEVEIRHSNVLAWLLDPSESHGLGALFLRRFLSSVLLDTDVESASLSPAGVELMPFGEVEVYRERHNIDILVRGAGGRGTAAVRWCLLVENKIRAKESKDQLVRYRQAVEREFPEDKVVPIFLTVDGDDPSDDAEEAGFIPLSHRHVLEVASSVIKQHRARIPSDAQVFLDHYLNSLRRITMEDPELVELCKQIYRKHREAITLIVDHGAASERYEICKTEIGKLVKCDFPPIIARNRIWFVPEEMGAEIPNVEMAGWKFLKRPDSDDGEGIPISFWMRYSVKRSRAGISLELGPTANKSVRQRILKAAEEHGLPVKEKHFATAKYARLITESMSLKENPDTDEADESEDYIREVCESLWSKLWPRASAIVPALHDALAEERAAKK